jgi:DNA-binding LytR/AlgR family response regulator
MTMTEAVALLSGGDFLRVHRSYIVNLQHVEVIEDDALVVDKHRIPVTDSYREGLLRALKSSRRR